jgi:hypothetical protein
MVDVQTSTGARLFGFYEGLGQEVTGFVIIDSWIRTLALSAAYS